MSKSNSKLALKLQSDIESSRPAVISNDDNISFLRKKYGNKYNDDISDTEEDNVSISDNKNANNSGNSAGVASKQNKKPNEYSQEFKQMVVQYIKSDDKIREVNEQLKEYKSKKKQAEDFILKELENYDEKAIIVSRCSSNEKRQDVSRQTYDF